MKIRIACISKVAPTPKVVCQYFLPKADDLRLAIDGDLRVV